MSLLNENGVRDHDMRTESKKKETVTLQKSSQMLNYRLQDVKELIFICLYVDTEFTSHYGTRFITIRVRRPSFSIYLEFEYLPIPNTNGYHYWKVSVSYIFVVYVGNCFVLSILQ